MSFNLGANAHLGYTVLNLDIAAKQDVAAGMRLVRLIRKNTKETPNAVSTGVQIPSVLDLEACMQNDTMKEFIVRAIQGVQNDCIRAVNDGGRNIITDSDFSLDAMVSFLESNDETLGRISKESIGEWFDSEMADTLTLTFADKLGISDTPTDAETAKLSQLNKQYRDCFCVLAGKKLSGVLPDNVVQNLEKALELIPVTGFGERMKAQIEKVKTVATVDMLAL